MIYNIPRWWRSKRTGELWEIDSISEDNKITIRKEPSRGWKVDRRILKEYQLRAYYMPLEEK